MQEERKFIFDAKRFSMPYQALESWLDVDR